MSRAFAGVLLALSACHLPGALEEGSGYSRTTVDLTAVSPTLAGGGVPIVAAAGKTLIGPKISRDAGATWTDINPAIDAGSIQAIDEKNFVCNTTQFGMGRWTIDDDQVRQANAPFAVGIYLAIPKTGSILMPQPGGNVIARGTMANAWSQVTLTKPATSNSNFLNVSALATSTTTIMFTSAWGVYRSLNDGVTWDLVQDAPVPPQDLLIQIIALTDGRFLGFAGNRTATVFDASGMPTGEHTPAFSETSTGSNNVIKRACLGGVIDGDKFTKDLGVTFQPLLPDGPMRITQSTCATGLPAQLIETAVRMGYEQVGPFLTTVSPELGTGGAVLPVIPATTAAMNFHLSPSGAMFANDQSWKPGETTWSLAPLHEGTSFLRDGSLLYLTATDVLRSTDDGKSYTATPRVTKDLTFLSITQDASGKLYGNAGGTPLQWLYTSSDLGVTWTMVTQTATDSIATYRGQPLELLRVADDGTLVARSGTSGAFASSDGGVTWRGEPFPSGFSYYAVTPSGLGVTFEHEDTYPAKSQQPAWHLWDDYGVGLAIQQITPQMMGTNVNVGDAGANIAIDKDNYMYMTGGGVPLIFKTTAPLGN